MRIRGYTHRLDALMVRGSTAVRKRHTAATSLPQSAPSPPGGDSPPGPQQGLRAVLERFGIGQRGASSTKGSDF